MINDIIHTIQKQIKKIPNKNDKSTKFTFSGLNIFLITILIINIFFIGLFRIDGHSMDNTLHDKQLVFSNLIGNTNLPYFGYLKDIKRGDIVILNSHIKKKEEDRTFKDKIFGDKNLYIKRVIGLPNEYVKIQYGKVYISNDNGKTYKELNEPYLNKENKNNTYIGSGVNHININTPIIFKVPKGQYFVLGDNRIGSSDSRTCFYVSCKLTNHSPFVKREDIIGTLLKK